MLAAERMAKHRADRMEGAAQQLLMSHRAMFSAFDSMSMVSPTVRGAVDDRLMLG